MKALVVVDPNGQLLCDHCHLADRAFERMLGVMGWKRLQPGEGFLLRPAWAIHTAFVRFPIDVVFLDREMRIVSIAHALKPWRLSAALKARAVLELAAGESHRHELAIGDQLAWAAI
jgi:uncharacterized membrane protein (UPF0127 family)